jgi:outer membrane protein assembly factor BamB
MNKKIVIVMILVVMSATIIPVTGLLPTNAGFTGQTKPTEYSDLGLIGEKDIWPMFRHDSGNTGCTNSYSPNTNHVAWKKPINSEIGQTTPILYGDKLYISTGWYYKTLPLLTDLINMTFPSPLEIIQQLFEQQSAQTPGLYCLNANTGDPLWSLPMDLPSDPAIVNDKVYITAINYSFYSSVLYCLDAATGSILWQKPVSGLILSPTIVDGEKIFLGCLDLYSYTGSMKCYDLSGNLLWNRPFGVYEFPYFSAPAVSGGYTYCITTNLYSYYQGSLYCINVQTGQIVWSKPIFSFGYWFGTSPVCADSKVYVTDFDLYSYNAYVKCYDGLTGDSEWTYPLGQAFAFAAPAVCDEGVYVTSFDLYSYYCWLYRIDPTDGHLIWKVPLASSSLFGFSSPVCSADKILLTPGTFYWYSNELCCFEKENGTILWSYTFDSYILGGASIGEDRAYVADYNGNVYMFEDVLKIKDVLGGLFGINAIVQNTGEVSLTNITWKISVTGGSLGMIDRTKFGTIQELPAGKSKIIRLIPVIGIGKITVVTEVAMPMMNTIKKEKQGLVLGSVCILLS